MKKTNWIIIFLCIVILVMTWILLYLKVPFFSTINNSILNIGFWTIVGAIATGSMAVATFITIDQNRKRWAKEDATREEDERARLVFGIFDYNGIFSLKIINVGKRTAYNIKIELFSVIPKILNDYEIIGTYFNNKEVTNIHLLPNEHYLMPLVFSNEYHYLNPIKNGVHTAITQEDLVKYEQALSKMKTVINKPIKIGGRYNNQYFIDEQIIIAESMSEFNFVSFNERVTKLLNSIHNKLNRPYKHGSNH